MIRSFHDRDTAAVFQGEHPRRIPAEIYRRAQGKLQLLHRTRSVDDLREPPSNRLEALHGDRQGQWSIRVNRQWRICFIWFDGDAYEVELVDYH